MTRNQLNFLFLILFQFTSNLSAQKADYIFIVTIDGLRWQEVFEGADSLLIRENIQQPNLYLEQYYDPQPERRRSLLMPFFWKTLVQNGQIYGNRNKHNFMDVANSTRISYPGYSELLTGFCDDKHIYRNKKIKNPNTHVLEFLSKTKHTAAFCSWDVFPYILNEERAGFSVNAGFETVEDLHGKDQLNVQQLHSVKPWKQSVRPDTLTWKIAQTYLEEQQPEVLYLAFGETDEYGHEGNYAGYLDAIRQFDQILKTLWGHIQHDKKYAGKSALVITTDHGRGAFHWKHHHSLIQGSSEIWMAVAGIGIEACGEIGVPMQIYQKQTAQTIARLVGQNFECEHAVAKSIPTIFEPTTHQVPFPAVALPLLNASTGTMLPQK